MAKIVSKITLYVEADSPEEMANSIKTLIASGAQFSVNPVQTIETEKPAPVSAPAPEEPKKSRSSNKTQTEKHTPEQGDVANPTTPPVPAAPAETPKPADTPKAVTLEQVRDKLQDLARGGKKDQVKKLIESFGAQKLTDIPAEKYTEVLAGAEAL
jgi:hypothetical protein